MRYRTAVRVGFAAWATSLWLVLLGLSGCASRPAPGPASNLLHDELFAAAAQTDANSASASGSASASAIFELSPAMRQYADSALAHLPTARDTRRALINAMYDSGGLGLSYDAEATRNAAQAFETRSGNCLSLVIMTAAFAKYLGMPVAYQAVVVDETYSRSSELLFISGHVNLVLGRQKRYARLVDQDPDFLTIDFLPAEQLRGQHTLALDEHTIVAMYMNNRAAEALARGRLDESYAWARQALAHDPRFLAGINTLGVLYLRAGHWQAAEKSLRHVLSVQPEHTTALANLAHVLTHNGNDAEAQALRRRLAQLQPQTPYAFLDRARLALGAGEPALARDLLKQELRLQPYQSEVHFWLAVAYARLSDRDRATHHLALAVENSTTQQSQALYAGKLALLRAQRLQ